MTLKHESLGNQIAELAAHLNAATARLLELIAEFDEAGGWADEGCLTCAHWLTWKCGISPGAAREKVRVARCLHGLPDTRAAFAQGTVSYSKVRALTRVATSDNEDYYLMIARHGTAAHMEKVVRGVRRVQRQRELAEANARHDERTLYWHYDDDGMLVVRARLEPEQGARFMAAVNTAMEPLLSERAEVRAEATYPARQDLGHVRADALLRLIDGGNPDTEIVVHVSAETLREDEFSDHSELEDGPSLPPETVRRCACDAGIVRLVEGPDGQPLDVGRKTRSIPPALRRALKARDGGCLFPGCDATLHVEGHHVHHWAHGGETSMRNLASLCRHHHRLVHEGGFGVEHRGDGTFRFTRPDGTVIRATPPRRVVQGRPDGFIRSLNGARGLQISAETAECLWDGWPMDEAQAVENALTPGELATF